MSINIGAQSHCFDESLAERTSIHFFGKVALEEAVLTLWVGFFEKLFETSEHNKSFSLMCEIRVEL